LDELLAYFEVTTYSWGGTKKGGLPVYPIMDSDESEAIIRAIDKAVRKTLDRLEAATSKDIKALEARIEKLELWASAAVAKKKAGRPPGSKSKKKAAAKKNAG